MEHAIYANGVGWLDQYGSYVDTFWEKGVQFFLRDYYVSEIHRTPEHAVTLQAKLDALNSEIQSREHASAVLMGRAVGKRPRDAADGPAPCATRQPRQRVDPTQANCARHEPSPTRTVPRDAQPVHHADASTKPGGI